MMTTRIRRTKGVANCDIALLRVAVSVEAAGQAARSVAKQPYGRSQYVDYGPSKTSFIGCGPIIVLGRTRQSDGSISNSRTMSQARDDGAHNNRSIFIQPSPPLQNSLSVLFIVSLNNDG